MVLSVRSCVCNALVRVCMYMCVCVCLCVYASERVLLADFGGTELRRVRRLEMDAVPRPPDKDHRALVSPSLLHDVACIRIVTFPVGRISETAYLKFQSRLQGIHQIDVEQLSAFHQEKSRSVQIPFPSHTHTHTSHEFPPPCVWGVCCSACGC